MNPKVSAPTYLVVGSKPWNYRVFQEIICKYPGKWRFISDPQELTLETVGEINPRYLFFLHWSLKVPPAIITNFECVCFHMTDVPYGRGGSPLQNLIARGHVSTRLTALRMSKEFDAGPVYLQEDLGLQGGAEEIYLRATYLAARMIGRIIQEEPTPVAQQGEATVFARRQPADSEIPELASLPELFDFIRMLDAEGYPRAFLDYKGYRFEFRRAALYDGRIAADVVITPKDGNKP